MVKIKGDFDHVSTHLRKKTSAILLKTVLLRRTKGAFKFFKNHDETWTNEPTEHEGKRWEPRE